MAYKPTCPDCGKETERLMLVEPGNGIVKDQDALCDGCQADRAVAAAYRGTDY